MRRKTSSVQIGSLVVSSEHPVMIQSMLNTSTMDTAACVEQAIRIAEAGGRLVRITAQGVKEAENLQNIRSEIRKRGYDIPLSADIHFLPEAAFVAAKYVDKVRINPGNFVDKRATFKKITYTEEEYASELRHLKEVFTSFLDICKTHHTAVRIGTNHGSLSDRIMSRYGNTPLGMVEATMEYLRVCREVGFENVLVSLKSSDCKIMVDAVRLLVERMEAEGMCYPLHLGVTEAGEGEDGRIRSAVGIGTLLNEGIGDTIRVSLTEAPENEIPVAREFVAISEPCFEGIPRFLQSCAEPPVIVADISSTEALDESVMSRLGFKTEEVDIVYGARLKAQENAPESIYTEALGPELTKLPAEVSVIVPYENLEMAHVYNRKAVPLFTVGAFLQNIENIQTEQAFLEIEKEEQINPVLVESLNKNPNTVLVLSPVEASYHLYRKMLFNLQQNGIRNKVIVKVNLQGKIEHEKLKTAFHIGGLFVDRLVNGLWIKTTDVKHVDSTLELSRSILQSAGVRRYRTEFISCPGCGRTLFDLQGAVAKVKASFSHLNRLKIAIMGCVVNGPGEMGDADYGYVGAGSGKVNLYKGKELVVAGIPEQEAINELKQLLINHGDWQDKGSE